MCQFVCKCAWLHTHRKMHLSLSYVCMANALLLTVGESVLCFRVCICVRMHVAECVLMIEGGVTASSMPQGEMTPGYAHAGKEGEASLDVPIAEQIG